MTGFKVGDRVRAWDGDEGIITDIEDSGLIRVTFEEDGDMGIVSADLELVTTEEEPRINGDEFSPESKRLNFELNVRRITDQIADLLISKNKQYSNSALDPIRVFSKADRMEQLRVRADDKLSRIRNGDTSEDAVLDLCGYLILMKIAGESE